MQAKQGYKYCRFCENYKKIEKFLENRKDYKINICNLCLRNARLKKIYGIGNEEYDKLLKKQKGKCALCRTKNPGGPHKIFVVDHNHKTGDVRGLLCNNCNTNIGGIEKRKIPITRLIKYLAKRKDGKI